MPLLRLTRLEYNNTVRDLLGDTTHPADQFPLDEDTTVAGTPFLYRRYGEVAQLDADLLRGAAEKLAAAYTPAPCSGGNESACATQFITTFGARAYRRPPLPDEIARLTDLYNIGRTTLMLDYPGGVRLLVEAMLQSPEFIYHWELGPQTATKDGNVIRLGPYELASRLSYFIWKTMPDQTLFDVAAAGNLAADADVEAQVRRMLGDPKAQDSLAEFFVEWLSLNKLPTRAKDAATYPQWNDAMKADMMSEAQTFVKSVVFGGDGTLDTLLTANYSFVDQTLGPIYGVSSASTTLAQTPLDPSQRAGILTQSGLLAVTGSTTGSHPVKRGREIYERFMCGVIPPPPNNVPPPDPPTAGGTTRQRFERHDHQACAVGCHSLMDPIGFAFEHYDGIGQWRTMDNGGMVDSKTTVTLDGMPHDVDDAVALSKVLAASKEVHDCFTAQYARYAFDRTDTPDDLASLQSAAAAFASGKNDVRELIVGIAKSRSFRFRSIAQGEMQ
jgi:hypothetical protein